MCGICGKVYFNADIQMDEQLILRMGEVLKHRGPDDSGLYMNHTVGLGHRRLSIIELWYRMFIKHE